MRELYAEAHQPPWVSILVGDDDRDGGGGDMTVKKSGDVVVMERIGSIIRNDKRHSGNGTGSGDAVRVDDAGG